MKFYVVVVTVMMLLQGEMLGSVCDTNYEKCFETEVFKESYLTITRHRESCTFLNTKFFVYIRNS